MFNFTLVCLGTLEVTNAKQTELYGQYIHENLDDGPHYVLPEYNFRTATESRRQPTKKSTVVSKRKRQTETIKSQPLRKKPTVPQHS